MTLTERRTHFQHHVDDIVERRIMDTRSLIDSVAGVVTNLFWRDAVKTMIQRRDVYLGRLPALARPSP